MLNRIYSRTNGRLDPVAAFCVGHNFFPGAVGYFNGFCHLVLAQLLDAIVTDGIHDTTGGHQFDPVGAVFNVAADYALDVFGGVGNIRLIRESKIRREDIAVAVPAGEGDASARRDDSGSVNQALLDAVTQRKLPVAAVTFAG